MTTMSGAVHLPLPSQPPEPKPGCPTCTTLAEQRDRARSEGDYSRVTDCNIGLRAHSHHPRPISR